jgi:cell division protein FtsW
VQFQPSELMKLALVLYAVKLLAERPKRVRSARELLPVGLVAGAATVLVASQPDLGTSLVMSFTLLAVLTVAGVPGRLLLRVGGAAAGLVTVYAVSAPYRLERLTTFLDPWNHAADGGYQAVQGQIAIHSGGLLGRGLGESSAKNLFLPEAHTDFILAIIGEEVGVIGVLGLLFLYGCIAFAGLRVAKAARGRYATLLAAGVTSMFMCQAVLNVFTVLGLAPLTGVPLPLVSYGSTNLIVLLAAMGLLLNVADGGGVKLRAVPAPRDAGGSRDGGTDNRDRSGRDRRARGAGAGGGRRAAG